MADTTFVSGTTIVHQWLNDVNNAVYKGNGAGGISIPYLPSGTGAILTTVQNKLHESISVKDFGAVGDGTTNDTAAINAAIASLPAGGGTVYFPVGVYSVTGISPIVKSNVTLHGDGMGASTLFMRNVSNANMLSFGDGVTYVRDVYVSNMRVAGNSANQSSGCGIDFNSIEGAHVISCEISDFKEQGIVFRGNGIRVSAYLTVSDCYVNTNLGDGIYIPANAYTSTIIGSLIAGNGKSPLGGAGFHSISNDTHRITGCIFDENSYGVLIQNCSQIAITGNVFEQNGRTSIKAIVGSVNINITGNVMINNSSESANTYGGVDLDACTYSNVVSNSVIAVNTAASWGIRETGASNYNVVTGNTIGGGGSSITTPISYTGKNSKVYANIGSAISTLDQTVPDFGGYVPGRYYSGLTVNLRNTAAQALTANLIYAIPMSISQTTTWSKIGIYIQATGTATQGKLGIYNVANGVPTTLVQDFGNISALATGAIEITGINLTLAPGMYALCCFFNGSVTVYSTTAAITSDSYAGVGTIGAIDNVWTSVFPYAGLPTPYGTVTYSSINTPNLWVRI